jgi:hypothetical protein
MSFPLSSTVDAIWARDGEAKISIVPATTIATVMQFFFIVLQGATAAYWPLGRQNALLPNLLPNEKKQHQRAETTAPGKVALPGVSFWREWNYSERSMSG